MAPQHGSNTGSPSQSDGQGYTGRYGSSVPQATVQQAPDQAVSHAGATAMANRTDGQGGFAGVLNGFGAYAQAAGAKQKALSSQAASQAAGLHTRPAPSDGNPNYHGMTSVQLSSGVQGASSAPSHESSEAWNAIGNALVNVNQTLAKAASSASSGWQGQAANDAMQFHTQVANWTNTTAAGAQVASVNLYNQSNAVATAQTSMPTPYTYTMNQAYQDVLAAPDPVSAVPTAMANLKKADENQQQSAQVATSYQQNLVQSAQQMPAMSPTPTFDSGGGGTGNPQGGPGSGSGSGPGSGGGNGFTPHVGSSGGLNGSSGSSGNGPGSSGVGLPPSAHGGIGADLNSGLQTQGFNPGGPYSGSGIGPGGGPGGGPSGGLNGFGLPMGYGGGGGYSGGYGGGGYGSGGSAGGLGRGGGYGASGYGSGGTGSGGAGSGSSASGGAAGRSTAGAGAAEDSAIESGAASSRGSGGMMGAGRGTKGQGDGEHKRAAYLVEADPDSIFGTDERTAPPVIGG
jgi:hypothetical protein